MRTTSEGIYGSPNQPFGQTQGNWRVGNTHYALALAAGLEQGVRLDQGGGLISVGTFVMALLAILVFAWVREL